MPPVGWGRKLVARRGGQGCQDYTVQGRWSAGDLPRVPPHSEWLQTQAWGTGWPVTGLRGLCSWGY